MARPKVYPCFSFDTQAEEAAKFYVSVFPNSRIVSVTHYPDGIGPKPGSVMTVRFELNGVGFTALNGGPEDTFNQGISFYADCETQAEVDRLWEGLLEGGGQPLQCGWLKDRYGVSWQVVPQVMWEILEGEDHARIGRAMAKMITMTKLDAATLEQA